MTAVPLDRLRYETDSFSAAIRRPYPSHVRPILAVWDIDRLHTTLGPAMAILEQDTELM